MSRSGEIVVVGGGPAGLRAAEVAATGGAQVVVYDAKPSVGRKFLVAGKSGLNLTHSGSMESFLRNYSGKDCPMALWDEILSRFDNVVIREWAADLGVETFEASSGKVFPVPVDGMIRAAPLLRRWVERLRSLGVSFKTGHRWTGFGREGQLLFSHEEKVVTTTPGAAVFALGGASWSQTGSDGDWVTTFRQAGISCRAMEAANCGWEVGWAEGVLAEAEGLPLKNVLLKVGSKRRRGELMITSYGLEGGPIYHLGPELRKMDTPEVVIDFKPDLSHRELVEKLGGVNRNFVREARRRWKLDKGAGALLKFLPDRGPWRSADQLASEVKHCVVPMLGPRPIEEAISTAGGLRWSELDDALMITQLPGVFVAGEMLDWEAPTGGYLLQGCFATGDYAGHAALAWAKGTPD